MFTALLKLSAGIAIVAIFYKLGHSQFLFRTQSVEDSISSQYFSADYFEAHQVDWVLCTVY
jgi:hypothetical protein